MARNQILSLLLVAFLVFSCFNVPGPVSAQTETGYDLVDAVNALRTSQGLEPYTIDPWIMAYAQQHSQYQADTQTSTHLHSDGKNSLSVGLIENVAGGDNGVVTVSIVVNEIWVDWGHLKTMTGYASGEVGAGVALGANNTIYYTLNVRPGNQTGNATTIAPPAATFIPIITNTPDSSGSIIHIVEPGETLWGIAVSYGVTMDNIRSLNGMLSDETTVYIGQRLFIQLAPVTSTPMQEAMIPTSTTTPPTPTPTPNPTATEIAVPTPTTIPAEQPVETAERNLFFWGAAAGAAAVAIPVTLYIILRKKQTPKDNKLN